MNFSWQKTSVEQAHLAAATTTAAGGYSYKLPVFNNLVIGSK